MSELYITHSSTALTERAESGRLSVRIGATYPLEHAADAQHALAARGTSGKIVVEIT